MPRAIWIFDRAFAGLTFISMASLLTQCEVEVSVFYTGSPEDAAVKAAFTRLAPNLEWIWFTPELIPGDKEERPTVLNRMARFEALRRYQKEWILLLDSDTVFSEGIQLAWERCHHDGGKVLGVLEHQRVTEADFFFRPPQNEWAIPRTPSTKRDIYQAVFGAPWQRLEEIPQYNNGILAFKEATALADLWERYYFQSLNHPHTNVADDQVPLAVAIHDLGIDFTALDAAWNSLGKRNGNYLAFHAWAGRWKIDFRALLAGHEPLSDFGRWAAPHLKALPTFLEAELEETIGSEPLYYQDFPAAFPLERAYRDAVSMAEDNWQMVEVGTQDGRGAILMAELIQASKKRINFTTLTTKARASLVDKFSALGLDPWIICKEVDIDQAALQFEANSLDLVCYYLFASQGDLDQSLERWYSRLRPGGLMIGFDPTIQSQTGPGMEAKVFAFCRRKGIFCLGIGQFFRFQKAAQPAIALVP